VTYGLTEAGCILTYSRLTREDRSQINSVGRPHPLVELRIVNPEGHDVAPGEVGEIVARGPTLMDGYWNLPERTAEALAGGWLHSGDLGRFDEAGHVVIAGRLKDMIVSGGENVFPAEVEDLRLLTSYDEDPELGLATRAGRLRAAAREETVLATAHFVEPFGRIEPAPSGLTWAPVA